MSKENEAVELLREWAYVWVGEIHADGGPLISRTKAFLAKHDIKPCPFCGSEHALRSCSGVAVICKNCGARGPIGWDGDCTIGHWNKRV